MLIVQNVLVFVFNHVFIIISIKLFEFPFKKAVNTIFQLKWSQRILSYITKVQYFYGMGFLLCIKLIILNHFMLKIPLFH